MLQLTQKQHQEAARIFELFEEAPFTNHGLFQFSERDAGEILKQVLVKSVDDEIHIAAQLETLDTVSVSLAPTPKGYLPVVFGDETTISDEKALKFVLGFLTEIRFEMEKRQRQGSGGGGGNKDGYYVEARLPSQKNELYLKAAVLDGVFSEELSAIIRRMGFRVQGFGSKVIA